MVRYLGLFDLELRRTIATIARSPISHTLGVLFLIAAFFALQQFSWLEFLGRTNNGVVGVWVYLAWMLCLGSTLEVSNGLCDDINTGVIAKIVQSPRGFRSILTARFAVATLFNFVSMALVGLALWTMQKLREVPDGYVIAIYAILIMQLYAVMIVLAAATMTQKTLGAAHVTGISIVAPLAFLPFEHFIGALTLLIPIAGPLAMLKSPELTSLNPFVLLIPTSIFIFLAHVVFARLIRHLKRTGTLLFI